MIEIVSGIENITISRDVNRSRTYDHFYWSANKVNFDEKEMPQRATSVYNGDILVGVVTQEDLWLDDAIHFLKGQGLEFAEIMEAFWFGIDGKNQILEYDKILVPGTQGHPPDDPSLFCPILFKFGTTVSLGIELLEKNNVGNPVLPMSTFVLLRDLNQ